MKYIYMLNSVHEIAKLFLQQSEEDLELPSLTLPVSQIFNLNSKQFS